MAPTEPKGMARLVAKGHSFEDNDPARLRLSYYQKPRAGHTTLLRVELLEYPAQGVGATRDGDLRCKMQGGLIELLLHEFQHPFFLSLLP